MPVKVKITAGNINDSVEACDLIDGLNAKKVLGDKGFDSDKIIESITSKGMEAVIPPKSNRKVQREYDKELYKKRHIVENAFLWFKRWRGIATRYCKNALSYLASVQVRCIFLWLDFLLKQSRADTI